MNRWRQIAVSTPWVAAWRDVGMLQSPHCKISVHIQEKLFDAEPLARQWGQQSRKQHELAAERELS